MTILAAIALVALILIPLLPERKRTEGDRLHERELMRHSRR